MSGRIRSHRIRPQHIGLMTEEPDMFTHHRKPQQWHLPTPFRDSQGGRITFAVSRPSLNSVVFLIGLIRPATALDSGPLEHHTFAMWVTYILCVLVACGAGGLVARLRRTELAVKLALGFLGVTGLWVGPAVSVHKLLLPQPLTAVAAVALITGANELAFRLYRRKHRPNEVPDPSTPRSSGAGPAVEEPS
jgi:hypothetical protein